MQSAPYGTWQSSITGDYLASRSIRLGEPQWQGEELYWLQGLPEEKGRQTIMRRCGSSQPESILPAPWNARSKVHEYGGGSYCLGKQIVFFVEASDQQIYQFDTTTATVKPFSNAPQCRFADLFVDSQQSYLYAICEDHSSPADLPLNRLVRFNLSSQINTPRVIDDHHDFVSNPQVSPDGQWLTYISWDNPNMPWDCNQLWLCKLTGSEIDEPLCLNPGQQESIFQPQWRPNGDLFWVSDRSNWWNLKTAYATELHQAYDKRGELKEHDITNMEAEFATPQWVFGMSTYGFLDNDTLLACYSQNGFWHLCKMTCAAEQWQIEPLETPCNSIKNLFAQDGKACFVGAGGSSPEAIYQFSEGLCSAVTDAKPPLAHEDISRAEPFTFASGEEPNTEAHGFYYAPCNKNYRGIPDCEPPLIVVGHGGPTGCCDPSFNYKVQYWTQRGFAVIEVNYRGSTGYGRQFRQALYKQWGIVDVNDLCSAAQYAVEQGWANSEQCIIRGSSAGGFSVLAALTDRDTFKAGVSLYGVADLELLANDTHKFEARYLDQLVGNYPQQKSVYIERSPLHKVERISCPLLVFQGLQDKVVPPNQAEAIVAGLDKKGIPVAYVTYSDEAHGFRSAQNICHQVEAELYFYQVIFQLTTEMSTPPPIQLKNWC